MTNPRMKALAGLTRSDARTVVLLVGKDLTPQQMVHQIPPGTTHIAWTLGHLAWDCDALAGPLIGRKPALSATWNKLFSYKVEPINYPSHYPALGELLSTYEEVIEGFAAHLEREPDHRLEEELPDDHPLRPTFPRVGDLLGANSFHTGYHAGQITMLRRAQGLRAGFGI